MKKSVIAIIIILVILAIIGIVLWVTLGNNANTPETLNISDSGISQPETLNLSKYQLQLNGKTMTPSTLFSKEVFGTEQSYSEIPSCAFNGVDKVYGYGSYEVTVCNVNGEEQIYSVYLLDDSVSTPEGIKIADNFASIVSTYGDNYEQNGSEYIYRDGNVSLSFIVENDTITSIGYTMMVI